MERPSPHTPSLGQAFLLLASARKKTAEALAERKALVFEKTNGKKEEKNEGVFPG